MMMVSLGLYCIPVYALIQPASEGEDFTSESALLSRVAGWSGGVPFPFWKNVGQIDRSSGIYLGNGYVLTAAHVGSGPFRTVDGKSYPAEPKSEKYFKNYDGSLADLCLFRIKFNTTDPIATWPSIPLTTMPPHKGTPVILVAGGAGAITSGRRFAWSDDYQVRWGLNSIEKIYSVPMPTSRFASFGFGTKFEKTGGRCQAAPGDSGGAAFHFNAVAKRWELAGVIVAVDSRFGAAEYGNQTYIADPALFRRELAITRLGPPAMLASGP
jgi:hypothetical protein